jgi:hypothetical protein
VSLPDKIRNLLATMPRWAFLLAVPIVAFVVATGIALGIGVGSESSDPPPAVRQRSTLTPVPTEVSEVVDPNNRKDCDAIRGTDYLSPGEREWYLENCSRATDDVAQTGTAGGGTGGSGSTFIAASEYHLGDRLVITSIGVDVTVTGADVGAGGQMPDPVGYFNAVRYKFPYHPGVGGGPEGNMAIAAHVDCAACHNGGPGAAAFYSVSKLQAGARATYYFGDGSSQEYVVRSVAAYSPGANWTSILSTSRADMTLITCGGSWDPVAHEYSTRWAAYLDKV